MSYATIEEWSERGAWYTDALETETGFSAQTVLDEASRDLDRFIGRRSMEPKTVTAERFKVQGWRESGRHLYVEDWPPLAGDTWFFTLTALEIFDDQFVSQGSVTVGNVTSFPADRGLMFLPDGDYALDGWTFTASYTCGFGSDVNTPTIPDDLREACLLLAQSKTLVHLGQGVEGASQSGVFKARARELLSPWMRHGTA